MTLAASLATEKAALADMDAKCTVLKAKLTASEGAVAALTLRKKKYTPASESARFGLTCTWRRVDVEAQTTGCGAGGGADRETETDSELLVPIWSEWLRATRPPGRSLPPVFASLSGALTPSRAARDVSVQTVVSQTRSLQATIRAREMMGQLFNLVLGSGALLEERHV
jgi:hypothetical protein